MMTINLFVIANVKQLRTDGSSRNLLPFFRTSWGVDVLNSAIFNSFHNRVEFGMILEGFRNFGGGGDTPPRLRHCTLEIFGRKHTHSITPHPLYVHNIVILSDPYRLFQTLKEILPAWESEGRKIGVRINVEKKQVY